MKSKWLISVGLVVCLVLCFALPMCAPAPPVEEEQFLKIGVHAPLTGAAASSGQHMQDGATVAVDEINASGGVLGRQIKLFVVDDEDTPLVGVTVAERLLSKERVDVLTGGMWAAVAVGIMDVTAKYGVPYISTGAPGDAITELYLSDPEKYRACWKTCPGLDGYGHVFWDYWEYILSNNLYQPKGRNIVMVKDDDSTWALPISEHMDRYLESSSLWDNGWRIVRDDTFPLEETDFIAQMSIIKAEDPDIVFFIHPWVVQNTSFVKQFRDAGLECPYCTIYAPSVPEYVEVGGSAVNGVLWTTCIGLLPPSEDSRIFEQKVYDKTGHPVSDYTVAQYEVIYMIKEAYERAGSFDVDKFIEEYNKTEHTSKLMGNFIMDPSTHCMKSGDDYIPVLLYQIQDGENVLIWPLCYAVGEYITPEWVK